MAWWIFAWNCGFVCGIVTVKWLCGIVLGIVAVLGWRGLPVRHLICYTHNQPTKMQNRRLTLQSSPSAFLLDYVTPDDMQASCFHSSAVGLSNSGGRKFIQAVACSLMNTEWKCIETKISLRPLQIHHNFHQLCHSLSFFSRRRFCSSCMIKMPRAVSVFKERKCF